ncbi:MAG: hypothetical protein IJG64_03335 [Oscillospiraceae bacterium]|nr:hypothetical protein [Oscillospiraceae bacterium]
MDSQKTGRQKKNTAAKAVAFLLPAFFMLIVLSLYGIRYHTNDDATLANIAAGAYGDVYHMVYVNMLFSLLLRPFYALAGANWYVIVQLLLTAVSMGAVGVILVRKEGALPGILRTLCVLVPFVIPLFYLFQYTKNAAVISAGGLLLVARELGSFSPGAMFGILLAFIGSLIRFESFAMAGAMFAVPLLFAFFRLDGRKKKNAVITVAVMLAAVFARKGIDTAFYDSDESWKAYREYNRARMEFSDHKVYLIGEENPFADRDVSETDFEMLLRWDYFDEDHFTRDRLNELSDSIEYPTLSAVVLELPETLLEAVTSSSYGKALAVFIICTAVLSLLGGEKRILAFLCHLTVLLVAVVFLVWSQRLPPYVELGLFFAFITGSVFIALREEKFKAATPMYAITLLLCMFASYPELGGLKEASRAYRDWAVLEQSYFEDMSRHKENLYLLSTESINVAAGLDVWHPRTDGFYSNIVAYGGWLSNAPHRKRALRAYGLQRPIVDGVDRENVFFDYHNINGAVAYASQERGEDVEAVSEGENAFAPYRLKSVHDN